MRLFQTSGYYPAYVPRLRRLTAGAASFQQRLKAFLDDRYGASHLLHPVDRRDDDAFFTNWDDECLQRAWAEEAGLQRNTALVEILLAQIEAHRTEIFYSLDPTRLANDFLKRLPGCVRKTIAWRSAPSSDVDFSKHDLVVSNFPSILAEMRRRGCRTAYFAPSHDPVMDRFASNVERPIDVVFVGGYSRHHKKRAQVLHAVAELADRFRISFHLDPSRLTWLAESPLGLMPPLWRHRRPSAVRSISLGPVFGLELYDALAKAKIVINGAVDMAGNERGNMRCFEAMGCGALLLSDEGVYPEGMVPGDNLTTYRDPAEAIAQIERFLNDGDGREAIACRGHQMISTRYSREIQWRRFQELL